MRTKFQLSPADERCRIIGALGTHGIAAGAIMSQVSNMQTAGLAICFLGVAATIYAFADLLKR